MSTPGLHGFPGGLQLPAWKHWSDDAPLRRPPLPAELVIPLDPPDMRRHPLVAAGDAVARGQPLAEPLEPWGCPVHASSSGTVTAIEPRPAIVDGRCLEVSSAVIRTDGLDTPWDQLPPPLAAPLEQAPGDLLRRLRDGGLAGMGGGTFPTAEKLAAAREAGIALLIINGVECEPCISCDDRLMREQADAVILGARLLAHIVGAPDIILALEEDRQAACRALEEALARHGPSGMRIVTVPVRYPAGGERQLIQTLTGHEVPSGGLPLDIGLLCHNAATAAAAWQIVHRGEPVTRRIVTLTGPGLATAGNVDIPLGTPVRHLLEWAGVAFGDQPLILGGPMMGTAIPDPGMPLTLGSNCLLVAGTALMPPAGPALPCIRCGACAEACPAGLLPQQLHWYSRDGDLETLRELGLMDCIECGACAVVCPSHIPLVQQYRQAKDQLLAADVERDRAARARARYEARQERLERRSREQERRRQQKKEALKAARAAKAPAADDPRKAAIRAAVERARRKKTESAPPGDNQHGGGA